MPRFVVLPPDEWPEAVTPAFLAGVARVQADAVRDAESRRLRRAIADDLNALFAPHLTFRWLA